MCSDDRAHSAREQPTLTTKTPISKSSKSSKDWKVYRQELDRIAKAIEQASSVIDAANRLSHHLPTAEGDIKSINLSFEERVWYKIPGEACCTWEVSTLIYLRY